MDNTELTTMFMEVAATVLAIVWAFAKQQELFKQNAQARWGAAVQSLEAGVERTYQEYVREVKAARADGKLTAQEAKAARDQAIVSAIRIAKEDGVDLVKVIGADYLEVLVSRIVKQAKQPATPEVV